MAIDLAFEVTGEGPPLVILHGLFGSARNWRRVARGLRDHYRVYSLDLRNHGESPWDSTMSYEAMADDVRAFIEAEGIAGAAVLGHSMGGKAAMALALARPELVGALIVVDVAPVTRPPELRAFTRAMAAIDLSRVARRADADRLLAPAIEDRRIRGFLVQNLAVRHGAPAWRLNLDVIDRQMEAIGGFPDHLLEKIYKGPTHFVTGALSAYVRPEHRELILRLFPSTTLSVIAGAGHWVHADRPESFLRAVARFLAFAVDTPPG
jgi:pimeloyl-ACP methyl ester carboxylesterase